MSAPRVAVLVIGDGRDAVRRRTLESMSAFVSGYREMVRIEVDDRDHALGFCGAIRHGWHLLRECEAARRASSWEDGCWEYVWHQEEDWLFNREVDVGGMAAILDADARVVQVALRRNAVNRAEVAAGGVVEQWPGEYEQLYAVSYPQSTRVAYLRHKLFWTTNPSLYRMSLLAEYEWPDGPGCEASFGATVVADGGSFAYLGARSDEPWVTHIGQRTGTGY